MTLIRYAWYCPCGALALFRNWDDHGAFMFTSFPGSTLNMKFLVWIGVAMVICWGVLWLGVKMAIGAVHLLLLLGVVLIVWGLFHKGSAPG